MSRSDASGRALRSPSPLATRSCGSLRLAHARHEAVFDGGRSATDLDVREAASTQVVAEVLRDLIRRVPRAIPAIRIVQHVAEGEHCRGIRVLANGEEQ